MYYGSGSCYFCQFWWFERPRWLHFGFGHQKKTPFASTSISVKGRVYTIIYIYIYVCVCVLGGRISTLLLVPKNDAPLAKVLSFGRRIDLSRNVISSGSAFQPLLKRFLVDPG